MWTFRAIAVLTLALSGILALPPPEVEIVLARCNENISWVDDLGYNSITTVYEKCGMTDGPGRHIPRANVGREGGTYLHHIVDRYESLADWTVFSQSGDPTYGYRGHRLGGGHMMRNVRFQDYVEAASARATQPRFYIFTTILVMRDWTMFQSIRRGYGEAYLPDQQRLQDKMCGTIDDWSQWFEFPGWFKDMVIRLQGEQHAPFLHFKLEEVLRLFDIKASHNVIFFAQGARFAISKEAIRMRPKSYYERLLPYFNTKDPWVGYFMEWLWWYVLSGSEAPCGFEAAALLGHHEWAARDRIMTTQEVSGSPGSDIQFMGNTTINSPQILVVPAEADVQFQPGSMTVFNAPVNVTGNGNFVVNNGAQVVFNAPAMLDVPAVFNNSIVNLAPGMELNFTGGDVSLANCQVQGGGTINFYHDPTERVTSMLSLVRSTVDATLKVITLEVAKRRTAPVNYAAVVLCGADQAAITLNSQGALELQAQCQVAGQPYSNVVGSLNATPGCIVTVTGVSTTSLPTLISAIDNPAAIKLELVNRGSGGFKKEILQYGTTNGACYNGWTASIDNCQSGYTCSVSGSTAQETGQCAVMFSQTQEAAADESNTGLLGILGLLALVPISVALCWYFGCRTQENTEDAFVYPYPNVVTAGVPAMNNAVMLRPNPSFSAPVYVVYPTVVRGIYQVPYVGGLAPVSNAGLCPQEINANEDPPLFDETALPSPEAIPFSNLITPGYLSPQNTMPKESSTPQEGAISPFSGLRSKVPGGKWSNSPNDIPFPATPSDAVSSPSRRSIHVTGSYSPTSPQSPSNVEAWSEVIRYQRSCVTPVSNVTPPPVVPSEQSGYLSEHWDEQLAGRPLGHGHDESYLSADGYGSHRGSFNLPPPVSMRNASFGPSQEEWVASRVAGHDGLRHRRSPSRHAPPF